MLKALIRKQWLQLFNFFLTDRRNGKRRSTLQILLYAVLFLYLFGVLAGGAYFVCRTLFPPLHEIGMDWLYFTLMGLAAILLGLFCSLFTTFSGLYQAKDNDLLFSLPIPPRLILFSRMISSYFMALFPMLLVLVPTMVAYMQFGTPNVRSTVFSILLMFILGFFVLVFACLLGWILAAINRYVRHKNLITIFVSIGFMGLYFYGYSQASKLFQSLLDNLDSVSGNIQSFLYPFYLMGEAFEGDIVSMLLFTGMTVLLFGITYWVLSRSFLKLSTARGERNKQKAYKEKNLSSTPLERALLRKECRRLFSSPTYLLNGILGSIVCCVGIVALFVKMSHLQQLLLDMDSPEFRAILPVAMAGALAAISSMNMLSSASISMEGKNLWILRTLPVPGWKILKAKWSFHMLFSFVPLFFLFLVAVIACHIPWAESLLILLFSFCFAGFSASLGLNANLRKPNLLWTNETAAVKENLFGMLCLYAEWGILGLFVLGYIPVFTLLAGRGHILPPLPVLTVITCCMALLFSKNMHRLKHKGVLRFENL